MDKTQHDLAIKRARGKFAAMVATYALGVFNDSFFRQSTMLIAVAMGRDSLQGWIMAVFALPYIIAAPQAGWLADRFSKRHVVIFAKALELVAMICGAIGILTGLWSFIAAMLFTMGLQSCLFGPALNGSIPELYPADYVSRANAILKVFVTAMILAGVSVAGVALEVEGTGPFGISKARWTVGAGIVAVSLGGLICSLAVPYRPAANPKAKFPFNAHAHTFKTLKYAKSDSLLWTVLMLNAYVWFCGALLVPLVNSMAGSQFGWGEATGSYLVAAELIGLAVGGTISGRMGIEGTWYKNLQVFMLCMLVPLGCIYFVTANTLTLAYVLMSLVGLAGGAVMVPTGSFIQVRPPAEIRGDMIASSNFVVFSGIVASGPIATGLLKYFDASTALALIAVPSLLVIFWLRGRLKAELLKENAR